MRWLTFAILTVLVLTLQAAAAPRLELFSARPDFLLIVVVYLGLYAPWRDAIAAGWILGVCADFMTIERFGVIALSYGLTAMIVTSLREYLFRYRVVTQTVVTLTACLIVRTSWTVYYHLLYNARGPMLGDWLIDGVIASAYTAALAPFAFRVLLRMSRPLGIPRPRGKTPLSSPLAKGGGRLSSPLRVRPKTPSEPRALARADTRIPVLGCTLSKGRGRLSSPLSKGGKRGVVSWGRADV